MPRWKRPYRDDAARYALVAVLLLALGACSVLKPAAASSTATPRQSASARAPKGAPTDANIVAFLIAANSTDIAYADQALAKSRDAEVRKFATMTRMDHESVNKAVTTLATRLKLKPVDAEASFNLRDDAEANRARLRDLDAFAFDSAYVHNEVAYNTSLLSALDATLVPAARNADLKQLLLDVRPAIAAHLDHAEILAAKKSRRR